MGLARALCYKAPWTMQGGLKVLSIDSTRFDTNPFPFVNSSCRKSICARLELTKVFRLG